MPIPYAPTCSRRSAALATYAENRDCPRCPSNSLSAGDEGRSLPNSRARKLTEPARFITPFQLLLHEIHIPLTVHCNEVGRTRITGPRLVNHLRGHVGKPPWSKLGLILATVMCDHERAFQHGDRLIGRVPMFWYVQIPWPAYHKIRRPGRRICVQDRYFETTVQRLPLYVVSLDGHSHRVGAGLRVHYGRPHYGAEHERTEQAAF